jgi:hypothetical protein
VKAHEFHEFTLIKEGGYGKEAGMGILVRVKVAGAQYRAVPDLSAGTWVSLIRNQI